VLIRDENESTSTEASSEQKSEGVFTDDEESRRKRQKIDYHDSDPKCFKKYDSLLNTFQPDNEDGRSLRRRESIPRGTSR
jgi:hypothetical protein